MTVAEMIEQQRKQCEARMRAREKKVAATKSSAPSQQLPKKMSAAERERAFIEDRTYDGKPPEGGMNRVLRKESPDEYVARDGTRTFVPWRYVSMQDLELPDNGNPYRKPTQDENTKKPLDPWGRPSGYVGSAAGPGMSPEYDPWSISGNVPASQGGQAAGWDDWLSPAPMQPPMQQQPADSWMASMQGGPAPAPTPAPNEPASAVDANGTLDIMRSMRP